MKNRILTVVLSVFLIGGLSGIIEASCGGHKCGSQCSTHIRSKGSAKDLKSKNSKKSAEKISENKQDQKNQKK